MRFLVEILVIAGLLSSGWNKPFKEWASEGYTVVISQFPSSISAEKRFRKAP
jgi:hypothetical protein